MPSHTPEEIRAKKKGQKPGPLSGHKTNKMKDAIRRKMAGK